MAVEHVIRDGRRIEVETIKPRAMPKRQRVEPHIGCPVEWLKRVIPLLKTPKQVGVAIWLHRRRIICGSQLFTVPNKALQEDLGLSRRVKYGALRHLAKAGVIALVRDGKHTLQVRLLW
jgi:hypothetical protein